MMTVKEAKERLEGLNYSRVADLVPCTRAYISAIATGVKTNPSSRMLEKIDAAIRIVESQS